MRRATRTDADQVHVREPRRPDRRGSEHRLGVAALLAGVVMLTFPTGGQLPGGRSSQEGGRMAMCTFTNPAYAGECVESAAIAEGATAEKACRAILDCLNDSRCPQTYCRATTIRSGWVLKLAKEQ